MNRTARHLILGPLAVVVFSATVWAQSTAQISGTVADPTGALLPGVEVTATKTDTGIARTVVTNETGSYVLPNLAVGPYRVEATLPGFQTSAQTGIVLEVNDTRQVNMVLEVGQVTQTIEVQANALQVETRSIGVSNVIDNERILELPLDGRDVTALITLSGAAVRVGGSGSRSMRGGAAIRVAGGGPDSVGYRLDGANHMNPYDYTNLPMPFPDALQEFRIETGALQARTGTAAGAAVSAVTKAGTNELHGNVFWFVRNDLFNARNAFSETGSTLKRNQFGGTIGGSIIQNKLFFFGGYQATTLRQDPGDEESFVPTAAMLAGDFRGVTAGGCDASGTTLSYAPNGVELFNNNMIDPANFSPAALKIAALLPQAQDACGRVVYGAIDQEDEGQAIVRVDYQLSDSQSLMGRFLGGYTVKPHPFTLSPDNILTSGVNRGLDNLGQFYTLGHTYLPSSNIVNSVRIAVNRTAIQRVGAVLPTAPSFGIDAFSYIDTYSRFDVEDWWEWGGSNTQADSFHRNTLYSVNNDLTIVRGSHELAFGGNLTHYRNNQLVQPFSPGVYTFDDHATGLSIGDFLVGELEQILQGRKSFFAVRQTFGGLYAQDTWRATPNLTLNYGVRWEPWTTQKFTEGGITQFSRERFEQNLSSTVFVNSAPGMLYPGDEAVGWEGVDIAGQNENWLRFAPRVGFAWDVQGDGRTSLRASFSVAYDWPEGQERFRSVEQPPWGGAVINDQQKLDTPWAGFPGGNPHPLPAVAGSAPFPAYGLYMIMDPNAKGPYSQSWNLSLERQITSDWLLSSNYIGSARVNVWGGSSLNDAVFSPGASGRTTNQRRLLNLENPNAFIGPMSILTTEGTGSYHGLLTSIRRRAVSGFNLSFNHTWSHCITDAEVSNFPTSGQTIPGNRRYDRGNCGADRRHLANATVVYETPEFAGPTMRALASGWRLSTIYRFASGSWLTPESGTDVALNGRRGDQRPDQILADPYGDRSGAAFSRWVNPDAYRRQAAGTHGNSGRANVVGPATWDFDVSLSRIFELGETQRVEFRAEGYNVLNSFRPGNPSSINNVNSGRFGQIRSSDAPRIMQFAIKYAF